MPMESMRIKAIVLHLEGILIQPDIQAMETIRTSIGCSVDMSAPDFIRGLPNAAHKNQILEKLEHYELEAAKSPKAAPATEEIMRFLEQKELRLALVTHSCLAYVQTILKRVPILPISNFETVISREDLLAPDGVTNPVQLAAEKMNLSSDQILTVAGELTVLQEALEAGTIAVFIDRSASPTANRVKDSFQISSLRELIPIMRLGIPLPPGKLPNDLLRDFFKPVCF